MSGKHIINEKF